MYIINISHDFNIVLGWFSNAIQFLNGLTYHNVSLLYYLIGLIMLSIMIRRIFNN